MSVKQKLIQKHVVLCHKLARAKTEKRIAFCEKKLTRLENRLEPSGK